MDNHILGAIVISLGTLIGIYWNVLRIKKAFQDEMKERMESAIKLAESVAESKVKLMEVKMDNLIKEINNLEDSVQKDIAYMKQNYGSEIKNLSDKIENLRDETKSQSTQILALLTKLIAD